MALSIRVSTAAGISIGTESRTNTPGDADYSSLVNLRPAHGSTNALNPPIISWPYMTNIATASLTETTFWEFQLQISGTNTFENFFVNLRTKSNMENRLAPITNANGSHYTAPLYWRRLYIGTNGLTNYVSTTNTFYISTTATNWDRSVFRNETRLASLSNHPAILLTPTNRAAMFTFLQTNDAVAWSTFLARTQQAVDSEWWVTNTWPTNYTGSVQNPGYLFDAPDRALKLGSVLLHYGMTNQHPGYTNRLVQQYTNLVEWFIGVHYAQTDYGSGVQPSVLHALVYGYDWLYHLLSPTAKARAELAMDRVAIVYTRNQFWTDPDGAGDGTIDTYYTNQIRQAAYYSMAKNGTSHANNNSGAAILAAYGALNTSTNAREFFDLGVNWLIAEGHFAGGFSVIHQGRGYAEAGLAGQSALYNTVTLATLFPEAELHRLPSWRGVAKWLPDVTPPNYWGTHDPHGDETGGTFRYMSKGPIGRKLAWFTRDGEALLSHTNWLNFYNPFSVEELPWYEMVQTSWLWPNQPAPASSPMARIYMEDGYAIGSTKSLNAIDAHTNGILVIVTAPPNMLKGHGSEHHGDVEISAYGAPVVQSGGKGLNAWGVRADAHNAPKVNGYGVLSSSAIGAYNAFPNTARVGEIAAYRDETDFFYVCVEITGAYTNAYNTSASNLVQSMKRHVFLSRTGKYVVIRDEFIGRSAAELDVNLLIQEPRLTNITSTGFRYGATNKLGGVVSNHVLQVNSGFTITNRVGQQILTNPVTGVYTADTGGESARFAHSLWFRGTSAVTNHSMLVLCPQKPGVSAPVMTALDDNTVKVVYDGVTETNTFGTNYAGAYTYRVELASASSGESGGGGGSGGSGGFTNGVQAGRVNVGVFR